VAKVEYFSYVAELPAAIDLDDVTASYEKAVRRPVDVLVKTVDGYFVVMLFGFGPFFWR
jgi:hypothetical protein